MAPSPCQSRCYSAAGDGSAARAQTPLHGVLFFGGKAGGEIFPPLSWRNSGFRAHTKLPRASPASHSVPARSRRRTQRCGRLSRSGPARRGSTAGSARGERPGNAGTGETFPRPGLAADPQSRRAPVRGPHLPSATPIPKGLHSSPRGSAPRPHPPGEEENKEENPRRRRRAPHTHRRRRLPRPPAPQQQQQHPAAGGQAAAPAPRLHRGGSGAPGPALRRGHSPAGQRGSLRRLPRPPLCRTLPASPGSSPPGTTVFLRSGGGRCGARCCHRPFPRSPRSPHTLPPGRGFVGSRSGRRLSPPRTSTGLLSAAEVSGACGWKGDLLPVPGRPSGGAGAGLSLGPPGPAQVRCRLGRDRANFLRVSA